MRKYEKYKDSDIEWIDEIPEHWKVDKLGWQGYFSASGIDKKNVEGEALVNMVNYTDIYGNEKKTLAADKEYMIVSCPEEKVLTHQVLKGDLLYTPSSETIEDIGLSALVIEDLPNTVFSYHVIRLQITKDFDLGFRKYLCNNNFVLNQFSREAKGTTRQIIGRDVFKKINIVIPPKTEQVAIANYLDKKTEEIDQLIKQKEQLLLLFEEEKTSIINQIITKGTNPNVTLIDSKFEWLGEIPGHWEVKKLKYIIKGFESGVSVNSLDNPIIDNENGILKTSCVYDYTFRPSENKMILNDEELKRARTNPKKGMIIISRMNTPELVGASGYVDRDYPNLFLPDRLWQTVFHETITINSKWLSFIFKSINFRNLLSTLATGTSPSMKNIGQEDVLNIFIPFPLLEEQESIAIQIEIEISRIEKKVEKTKKLINLLKEYKTALISEVATGEIKVI